MINTTLSGRYKIIHKLSEGGMGAVYSAKDLLLENNVVIKVVLPEFLEKNQQAEKIFKSEATNGFKLAGHSSIISILDFSKSSHNSSSNKEEIHYIVMEYIQGINVDDYLSKYKETLNKITCYFIDLFIIHNLLSAILFMHHRRNMLHRDIKPQNLLLSIDGLVKLGDFGLSKLEEASTRQHTVKDMGTIYYYAPEQFNDQTPTQETDLYQVGCNIYHILSKNPPFIGTPAAITNGHLNEIPIDIKNKCSLIPNNFSEKIMKSLEKKPQNRGSLADLFFETSKELLNHNIKLTVKNSPKLNNIGIKSSSYQDVILLHSNIFTILAKAIQLICIDYTDFQIDII